MNTSIENRIQRLEDLEEIRFVQSLYGHYVDKGWNGYEMTTDNLDLVFTKDAIWESKEQNISVQGYEQIAALFKNMNSRADMYFHNFANPMIELDGDKANAQWRLISPMKVNGEMLTMYASYNNDYERTPDGWRIKVLRLDVAEMPNV